MRFTAIHSPAPRLPRRRRTALPRLVRSGILAAGAVLLVVLFFRDRIGEQIGLAAAASINRQLEGSGWQVSLRGVRFIDTGVVRIDSIGLVHESRRDVPVAQFGPVEIRKQDLKRLMDLDLLPDSIRCDQGELVVEMDHPGHAAWPALLERLPRLDNSPRLPQVTASQCRVLLRNPGGHGHSPWLLHDFELESVAAGNGLDGPPVHLRATCRSNRFETAVLAAGFWPAHRRLAGSVRIDGIEATTVDLDWLPSAGRNSLGTVSLFRARASLRIDYSLEPEGTKTGRGEQAWTASGRVENLDLACSGLPVPLSRAACDFVLDRMHLDVRNATAALGAAEARISGLFGFGGGGPAGMPPPWSVQGELRGLRFEQLDAGRMPAAIREAMAAFSPGGTGDLQFSLAWDGQTLQPDIRAQVHDMSFTHEKFRYPLEHCVGNAAWQGNEIRFSLQSLENGRIVDLNGWVRNPGPAATCEVAFSCPGDIPVDERLLRALEPWPRIAAQVRDLRLRGSIGVNGTLRRAAPDTQVLLDYTVDLRHCQIRPAVFEFPVRELTGQVHLRGSTVQLRNVSGTSGGAAIRIAGGWTPEEGLALRLIADRLNLDHQLRSALPPAAAAAWDCINPEGRADVVRADVTLANRTGAAPQVQVHGDLRAPDNPGERGVSIRPSAFPWAIQRVSGRFSISDGKFQVERFRGVHSRAWVSCDAAGTFGSHGWKLNLTDLAAGGLEADEDLLRALPRELSGRLRQSRFRGGLQVAGAFAFRGPPPTSPASSPAVQLASWTPAAQPAGAPESAVEAAWRLRIDLTAASANLGLPLENVAGVLFLDGDRNGGSVRNRGSFSLDSASVHGAWISGLQGPVLIDQQRLAIGRFATDEDAAPQQSARGVLFGGELGLDAHCWDEGGQTRYFVEASLRDGQMSEATGCLPGEVCKTAGRADCQVRCRGVMDQRESISGDGELRLREARLYELPVMMTVLGSLRRRDGDRRAFDAATAQFSLRGDRIDLNRIELNGDAISLIGDGNMDWHRAVNLDFYTVMGRNRHYIPVLSELYRASSQQILWLSVNGTIDQPEISQQILPGINEGLRMLLEPDRISQDPRFQ